MVVSCPKCSSRYQLSDDKVKAEGTKVRCPRCQNTFKVFPEAAKEPAFEVEKTELSIPVRDFQSKAASQKAVPAKEVGEQERGPKTHVPAASAAETMRSTKTREPSPFKRPLQDEADEFAREDIDEQTENLKTAPQMRASATSRAAKTEIFSEDSEEATANQKPESNAPKPFGDATFLAIQKMGGARESRRKSFVVAAFVILALSFVLFFLYSPQTRSPLEPMASKQTEETIRISRPTNWYQDNPAVFQKLLGQMATLPKAEQDKPSNKALIAEALVLNGIVTGAYDQVAQGTAYASDLITTYSGAVYGFYARAAYAVYKDDTGGLITLASNWPKSNQTDSEFLLVNILALSKSGQKSSALVLAKAMLDQMPDFQRGQLAVLNIALDSWKEAETVLGEKTLTSLIKAFGKTKEALQSSGAILPDLINSIDKKLLRRSASLASAKSNESSGSSKPSVPDRKNTKLPEKKVEKSLTDSLNKRAQKDLEERKSEESKDTEAKAPETKAAETKVTEPKEPVAQEKAAEKVAESRPAPKEKAPTKLPPPNAELVASAKQEKKEQSEAGKLYQMGLTQIEQGRADEAILSFQKSLRFDPDYAESYRKLGEIYMKRDERDKALRALKIYLRLRPDSSDRQVVQGWISSLE